jgi:ribonuclease D
MTTAVKFDLIDDEQKLGEVCEHLDTQPWLAIDTEFVRDNTYYPTLCLVQIATDHETYCIDTIEIKDLSALWQLLHNQNILKVFHSSRQDLEAIFHYTHDVPRPVFDTQIAATLLGYTEQIAFARLVNDILNIKLTKTQTRSDWTLRPLSHEQLQYAAEDALYLSRIYRWIHTQLEQKNRLHWLDDDFNNLYHESIYNFNSREAWKKVKFPPNIKGATLAIIHALAQWREDQAKTQNKPRGWICKDNILIDLAKLKPRNPDDLKRMRGVSDDFVNRYGADLLALISENKDKKILPAEKHRDLSLDDNQTALMHAIEALVALIAEQEQINTSTLLDRKTIKKIIRNEMTTDQLHGWRHQLIAPPLNEFLQGKTTLQVERNALVRKNQ